tara:strand:+ start:4003 stop:4200 length:198 start_codon:yes stop_codon:yes gene_type:complete
MQIGDLVKIFNERGLNELAYIKKFGRYGKSSVMIVYLSGRCIGQEQFFSEFNVLPIKELTGEKRA